MGVLLNFRVHQGGPGGTRLGCNIEAVAFFTKNDAFNDMMTQAGTNGGAVWGGADARDANGWPLATSNNIRLRQSMNTQPGVYKVQFESLSAGATAAITSCTMSARTSTAIGGGRYLITYDATYATGDLDFSYASSVGGITNLKVTHPGQAVTDVLNNEFRARAANFTGLRFYQSQGEQGYGVNTNNDKFWADRRKPTYATWCTSNDKQNGIPYEAMILMCNELNVDCYVQVPFCTVCDTNFAGEGLNDGRGASTSDYVTKMAQVFRYGSDGSTPYTSTQASPVWAPLKPGLKLYVEFSNELWNGSYPYSRDKNWIAASAARLYAAGNPYAYRSSGTSGYQPSASRIGHMIMTISDLFRAVWGNAAMGDDVRIMSSGFTGDNFCSQVLGYIDDRKGANTVAHYVYAFAVAPYFNQHTGTATQILNDMAADAANTNTATDDNGGGLVRDIARAQTYGVKLCSYEGGVGCLGITDDAIARQVQTSIRVKDDVLVPYLTRWFQAPECEAFFYYTMLKTWSTGSGAYFGLSELVTDETGPKWDAVKQIRATVF
jgi:hypothetical protein